MADRDRLTDTAVDASGSSGSPVFGGGLEWFPGRRIALGWHAPAVGNRRQLVRRLLAGMGSQNHPGVSDGVPEILQDSLGRPYLRVSGMDGPSVSFSRGAGRLWAALIEKGRVGVDVTSAAEFEEPYPYDRVFQLKEMAAAQDICRGLRPAAAALLWSVKEAAVKTLGCGFHRVDPLDLTVVFHAAAASSVTCGLEGLRNIRTLSIRTAWGWLSLAASRHGLHFPMPGGEP